MQRKIQIISAFILVTLISCVNNKNHNDPDIILPNDRITTSQGYLVCKEQRRDFGIFQQGKIIECDFSFYNKGSEELEIIDFDASCTCSELKFSDMTIEAGDSLTVTMIIQTIDKRKGKHKTDAFFKTNGTRRFYNVSSNYEIE